MSNTPRHMRCRLVIQESARVLRHRPTPAEALLWERLRGRRLAGHKFRRQHPIGHFVVDFCCVEKRLVVEVDGSVHLDRVEADAARTAWLEGQGFRVLRFQNRDVLANPDAVLAHIMDVLKRP
ncbi:MAG: endonuclease domain-containing protein [Anaerolineae bacterium]